MVDPSSFRINGYHILCDTKLGSPIGFLHLSLTNLTGASNKKISDIGHFGEILEISGWTPKTY